MSLLSTEAQLRVDAVACVALAGALPRGGSASTDDIVRCMLPGQRTAAVDCARLIDCVAASDGVGPSLRRGSAQILSLVVWRLLLGLDRGPTRPTHPFRLDERSG
eukprot:CAMPEP_0178986980 /NCGR_PEP_ID=MMETSP0795-20121207/3002_1 /TAXON_ID=88552 /ORGANISM="Amoebophrya sp., Strain Ameob2" /LENGTH=104 /DNA_ID=CAMNT_0020678095 /DNA_START=811 /DNA_END=1122 /DNA_ORIENTATION=-